MACESFATFGRGWVMDKANFTSHMPNGVIPTERRKIIYHMSESVCRWGCGKLFSTVLCSNFDRSLFRLLGVHLRNVKALVSEDHTGGFDTFNLSNLGRCGVT